MKIFIASDDNYLKLAILNATPVFPRGKNVIFIDNRTSENHISQHDLNGKMNRDNTYIIYLRFEPFFRRPLNKNEYDICGKITKESVRSACLAIINRRFENIQYHKYSSDIVNYMSSSQRRVIELLLSGMSIDQTAEILNLSKKTVYAHRYNCMQKLGFRNHKEFLIWLLKYAKQNPELWSAGV